MELMQAVKHYATAMKLAERYGNDHGDVDAANNAWPEPMEGTQPDFCTEVDMRDMIWNAVRAKVPEGMILPWWALVVRAALYPLDFFYWRMSKTRGYQWQSDTWLIEGVTYSGAALRWLAKAQGETYRVTRTGETVTLEQVPNAKSEPTAPLLAQVGSTAGLVVAARSAPTFGEGD